MLVENLKLLISSLNQNIPSSTPLKGKWNFNYGKEHWQNLGDYVNDVHMDFIDRQKYLLLLWKDRSFVLNSQGGIQGYSYDGEMVLLVRSKISDPTYNYKYETHIKNLEGQTERLFNGFSDCDGWTIKSWKEVEVSNEFDTNLDGLKIRFTIEFEE
jgi:hypothetical protein